MKNLKTTIFGLLAAIGGYFASNSTGKIQGAGQIVATISTFLLGASAQDSK
jgi:biopolymer transport protein ExbB/TolQ